MTITDEDYNKISDTAYWIDPIHKKYDPKIKKDEIRKINGKADTSQVVIAYAGTNSSDKLDIATDIQT